MGDAGGYEVGVDEGTARSPDLGSRVRPGVAKRDKAAAAFMKLADEIVQVPARPGDAIELCDHDVLIFQFANKAALDKAWADDIKPWEMRDDVRKLADFHAISVEGVEPK
jgi:hypothetical protein